MKIRQILTEIRSINLKCKKGKDKATEEHLKTANKLFKSYRDNGYLIFHKELNNMAGKFYCS